MINLDPSLIDQDSIRKKRRKKMLLTAATPVVFLLGASLFFLRPGVFNILYNANFNNTSAKFIISISDLQTKANYIEPYIAHYNYGTAYIKDNDGKNAESELRESLRNNPPADKVCQVRTNLAYSIEMQADQENIKKHYGEALILYSTAEGVLYGDNCVDKNKTKSNSNKSRDDKAEAAKERISRKRGKIVAKMNGKTSIDQDADEVYDIQINENQLEELRNNLSTGLEIQDYSRRKQFGGGAGGGIFDRIQHW